MGYGWQTTNSCVCMINCSGVHGGLGQFAVQTSTYCRYWKIFHVTNCYLNSFTAMPFAISAVVWLVSMTKIVTLQLKSLILFRFDIWVLQLLDCQMVTDNVWSVVFIRSLLSVYSGTPLWCKSRWVSVVKFCIPLCSGINLVHSLGGLKNFAVPPNSDCVTARNSVSWNYTHTHNTQPFYCWSGICPGPPGSAGTRKVKPRRLKPIWIYWSKR